MKYVIFFFKFDVSLAMIYVPLSILTVAFLNTYPFFFFLVGHSTLIHSTTIIKLYEIINVVFSWM